MNKRLLLITFFMLLLTLPIHTGAQEEEFKIARFMIAGSIEDREPVGIVNEFAASTEKVYCFLEARDIKADTEVNFVWFYGDREMARVTLPLKKGLRWRTWSSKRLGGLKGKWRVELRDSNDQILRVATFTVQ